MKKLNVRIHKNGTESEKLLRLVGNVNDGKAEITVRELEGYFATQNAIWPSLTQISLIPDHEPNTYHISEDGGKTFTMSLEWAEVHDLTPMDELKQLYATAP